jgi:hypothetical protein
MTVTGGSLLASFLRMPPPTYSCHSHSSGCHSRSSQCHPQPTATHVPHNATPNLLPLTFLTMPPPTYSHSRSSQCHPQPIATHIPQDATHLSENATPGLLPCYATHIRKACSYNTELFMSFVTTQLYTAPVCIHQWSICHR